jgi:hypothetical protein
VRQQSGGTVSWWQRLEWQDLIRLLIPAAAFVGWTMLEPTSVWNAVAPSVSGGMRILIPLVGAVFLAAVTKALVSHSDNKPSSAQMGEQPTPELQPEPRTTGTATEQPTLADVLQRVPPTRPDARQGG